jgi:hypothetical protein
MLVFKAIISTITMFIASSLIYLDVCPLFSGVIFVVALFNLFLTGVSILDRTKSSRFRGF